MPLMNTKQIYFSMQKYYLLFLNVPEAKDAH